MYAHIRCLIYVVMNSFWASTDAIHYSHFNCMPYGLETPMTDLDSIDPTSNLSTGSRTVHACNFGPSSKVNRKEKFFSSGRCDATIALKAERSAFLSGPLNHLL